MVGSTFGLICCCEVGAVLGYLCQGRIYLVACAVDQVKIHPLCRVTAEAVVVGLVWGVQVDYNLAFYLFQKASIF